MALILASQSASRRAMLDAAGVVYQPISAHVDESAIRDAMLDNGAAPAEIARALAEAKALHVAENEADSWVIGGDSIVAVDGQLFEKPRDRQNAAEHLAHFSGRVIDLYSAVVLAKDGAIQWGHVDHAVLAVRKLSPDFIDSYLDAEWPAIAGCVGCFRMEARGVQLFEHCSGSHFTILGMPLLPLLAQLRAVGEMPS